MAGTAIDSVAIRLNELGDWAGELKNLRPIVFFAEQGLQGAEMKAALSSERQPLRHPSPALHDLERVIFIIDRSGSMEGPLVSGPAFNQHTPEKYRYIQEKIARLAHTGCFPDNTKVSLVQFDGSISRHDCGVIEQGALGELRMQLAFPWGGGTTEFSKPLQAAVDILLADRLTPLDKRNDSQNPAIRSLVFFLTDGVDRSSQDIAPIIRNIRDLNAMTFVCGIGEDYDMKRIIEIASHAGAATWSHVPLERGAPDVFEVQIPDLIRQLTSEEHYLKIRASGDFRNLSAVNPSIRDVVSPDNQIFSGYITTAAGLLLEKNDNISLQLAAGRYSNDRSPLTEEIPIVDIHDAGAYYEQARSAEEVLEKFLLLKALRERDIPLLRGMLSANSKLESVLNPVVEEIERLNRDNSVGSHSLNSAMSVFGYSQYGDDRPVPTFDSNGPVGELFSGNLGPLDNSMSIGDLPQAKNFNPRVYDSVVPNHVPTPVLEQVQSGNESKTGETLSLASLKDGVIYQLGRRPRSSSTDSVTCCKVSEDLRVSRSHCQIYLRDGTYYLKDVGSTNGTYVDGLQIAKEREVELMPGAIVSLGRAVAFIFKAPKKEDGQ